MSSIVANARQWVSEKRDSRTTLLFIVYVALFIDNMLLTTVVPIVPEYLFRLWYPDLSMSLLDGKDINGKPIVFYDERGAPRPRSERVSRSDSKILHNGLNLDNQSTEQWPGKIRPKRQLSDPDDPSFVGVVEEDDYARAASKQGVPCDSAAMFTSPVNRTALHFCRHELMTRENVLVGIMFGSKAVVQLITNPFIGPLTNRIGYTIPMFAGFVIMFFSTILFAFGDSYATLWFARSLQGVGSACTSTSGMGMLAQAYPDDEERGTAMGIALGGLALGVLVGPTFGGVLYEWSGKALPFVLLALLALLDGSLQFLVLQPQIQRGVSEGSSMRELSRDPYIMIAALSITIGNLGIAMLEPSLPIHMMDRMHSSSFERGIAFLPASISYLIGTSVFGTIAHKMGRWLCTMIGLVVIGFSLMLIPEADTIAGLILPNACMGFAIGMIDASMFPAMGHLVDIRHGNVYGSIYAIADAAFCFAFAIGPFMSGPMVAWFGFGGTLVTIAIINLVYAPFMYLLKDPPTRIVGEEGGGGDANFGKLQEESNGKQPINLPVMHGQAYGGTDEIGAGVAVNSGKVDFNAAWK